MTLEARIAALATRIGNYLRDSVLPRLLPTGGTTGQVLQKTSATNFAVGWAAPGGGSSGWTLIQEIIVGAAQANVTFNDIPTTYNDLYIVIDQIKHNNGSNAGLQLSVSPDGVTFTTPFSMSNNLPASSAISGGMLIPNYQGDAGIFLGSASNAAANSVASSGTNSYAWRVAGGIEDIRLVPSAGAIAQGTVRLYGR